MILELEHIEKDYGTPAVPVPVLHDVNLQLEQGEYLAIMGPSGSGKSTLMNILGYLDVPTRGVYRFDGEDNTHASDSKMAMVRNRKIGFVFQSFHLLAQRRAWENVALPLMYAGVPRKERKARAIAALERMGLAERVNFFPTQLSGGQCQRVAIARAIVTNPLMLLADEPTGALDSKSGQQIMDIFEELHEQGMTIVMITHEQAIADRAERILYIYDGYLKGGDLS
ncbi:MAG: ABC transporter ATP-binding protein [Clostridia bacterium]|nr:ABC transporter ATP-binding protein [Clostridia bacterium]